jgi:hypothetical protein
MAMTKSMMMAITSKIGRVNVVDANEENDKDGFNEDNI